MENAWCVGEHNTSSRTALDPKAPHMERETPPSSHLKQQNQDCRLKQGGQGSNAPPSTTSH
eukprot:12882231-Prorocentrum_lima.AAC.1